MNDFPAILLDPARPYDRIRQLYLYREPELMAAIRCGDRRAARKIINHLLVHIYSAGEQHSELLKGLLLELVVMMARAAVESGASQTDALGLHFRHLTELAEVEDEEDLSQWLRTALERLFTIIARQEGGGSEPRIARVLDLMRANIGGELSRDDVARQAGLSPSHLAHLLRQATGSTFSELLRGFRVEAAATLLRTSDRTLADIASACGFCDQSHFTHSFREARGQTPRQFRESANTASASD
jgi:AraC-like DNA-binding protein